MTARPPAPIVASEMFGSLTAYPTGMPAFDAQTDFRRARRAHAIARAAGRFTRQRGLGHPPTMDDRAGGLEAPRHIEVVPLHCIVGTLEPTVHFDARFRPASELVRPRWERIALAHRVGRPLPPIDLVKRPDGYYVLDGRHRVSVALALGHPDIEALVRGEGHTACALALAANRRDPAAPAGAVTPCTKRPCSSAPDAPRSGDRLRAVSPRRAERSQGPRRD